jgi:hypothetical protein
MRLLLTAAVLTAALSGSVQAGLPNCANTMANPVTITVNPGQSIQTALDSAKPGTVIRVKAGTYKGSLSLSKIRGTAAKPIILVSADGPGKAVISGSSTKAAVSAWGGTSYFGMYGFRVVSNTSSGDIGGFKIAGEWNNPPHDLVFASNTIVGKGQDAFKLFGGAYNVAVVGNVVDGQWRQEAFDNVSVEDVIYAHNTVKGTTKYTALTVKHGSRNVEVFGNLFNPTTTAAAMTIGGYGSSGGVDDPDFPAEFQGFDAEDVVVHHNVIGTNVQGQSATFVGARYSTLADNQLPRTVGSKAHSEPGEYTYHSHHNTIRGNFVSKSTFFQPSAGEDVGYIVEGNKVGQPGLAAGAAAFTNNALGICPGKFADGVPTS